MVFGDRYRFETHLTVAAGTDHRLLEEATDALALKRTIIELAGGETPIQPMVTIHRTSSLRSCLGNARRTVRRLRQRDVEVVRTKVELPLRSAFDWDLGTRAWRPRFDWIYAEQHLLVRLPDHAGAASRLQDDVIKLGAHLSRSPRSSKNGLETRFVTSRVYFERERFDPDPRPGSRWRSLIIERFDSVGHELRRLGWGVVTVDRELVVHDSNLALDDGWLPPEPTQVRREASWVSVEPAEWPNSWALPSSAEQPRLFDPSVKHLGEAYRRGDPSRSSDEWHASRGHVFGAALRSIAASPARESLCLRGSALLPHHLGSAARTAGDIDWVVMPSSVTIDSDQGIGVIEATKAALGTVDDPRVKLYVEAAEADNIWTYDRVPGRRLTVPWSNHHGENGVVQMDFVFGEKLWQDPVEVVIMSDDGPANLLGATPELSLAWKVLWLASDMYPQGKDLYDAVLLAERHRVDRQLISRALSESGTGQARELAIGDLAEHLIAAPIGWDDFVAEYPDVGGTPGQWISRLTRALTGDS